MYRHKLLLSLLILWITILKNGSSQNPEPIKVQYNNNAAPVPEPVYENIPVEHYQINNNVDANGIITETDYEQQQQQQQQNYYSNNKHQASPPQPNPIIPPSQGNPNHQPRIVQGKPYSNQAPPSRSSPGQPQNRQPAPPPPQHRYPPSATEYPNQPQQRSPSNQQNQGPNYYEKQRSQYGNEEFNAEQGQPPRDLGPVQKMDLPDDEYRRVHGHMHLFDDSAHQPDDTDDRRHTALSSDDIVDEWSEHMEDFIPDMLVTFRLPHGSDEYFYQAVGPEPTLIRGGYFVAGDNATGSVRFNIFDPQGDVIVHHSRSESLFNFKTNKAGVYAFNINNPQWTGTKFVTFVVGVGNETTLSVEHLHNAEENVKVLFRMIGDIRAESQYLWSRQKTQMASVRSSNSRIAWLSLLELVFCIAVLGFQVHFLKRLVSNKRIF